MWKCPADVPEKNVWEIYEWSDDSFFFKEYDSTAYFHILLYGILLTHELDDM